MAFDSNFDCSCDRCYYYHAHCIVLEQKSDVLTNFRNLFATLSTLLVFEVENREFYKLKSLHRMILKSFHTMMQTVSEKLDKTIISYDEFSEFKNQFELVVINVDYPFL